jgi:hypothetical protein
MWSEALVRYLHEGPTDEGLMHIVTAMKFQSEEEFLPRLTILQQWLGQYEDALKRIHAQLVGGMR